MRSISKLFSAALILILAAACNTKEIDNPDNPDKPKAYDNIILTAGINQTRVDYSVVGSKLVPGWVEGDVIFGYFGSGDGSQIEFTVDDVKEDGTAVLEPGKGWDDFLQQFKSLEDGETLPIGLIYTGSEASYSPENPNDVIVSMKKQTGVNIPACMHASRYIKDKDDEAQIIRFLFDNDCAIFEIESITGIAEDAGLTDVQALSLTSLTITNLIPTYEYTYASGALSGKSGTGDLESYTITLPENTWEVNYLGNINHSSEKNLLVAVAPNSVNNILITATTEGGRQFSYLYHGELVGGQCYIIRKRDVVAKTSDGQYFTSVSEAFDRAAVLSSQGYTTAAENVVTLIKKDITGFGDVSEIGIDYPVTLDLNGCTLNLSGTEYFRVINDYFAPLSGALTITDSTGPDSGGVYDGTINSTSVNSIIFNIGVVNIHGGTLNSVNSDTIINEGTATISGGTITSTNASAVYNCEDAISTISGGKITSTNSVAVNNEGDLTISKGELYSHSTDWDNAPGTIENYSTLKISGGKVESDHFFPLYNSGDGEAEITGGKLISYDDSAIFSYGDVTIGKTVENEISITSSAPMYSDYTSAAIYMLEGSKLEIYSGTVTSSVGTSAIILEGAEGNITGGVISNKSNSTETVQILDGASCIISGGVIYSEGQVATIACRSTSLTENSKLWITWPIINSDDEEPQYDQDSGEELHEPLIYSFGSAYQSSPITANYDHMDNTAEVYIQGGYLLTHNQNSYGFFYNDDASPQGEEVFDNLIISGCGKFYANTFHVNMQGSTYNSSCDIDLHLHFSVSEDSVSEDSGSEDSDLPYIPDFFEDYFDKKDFKDGFPEETVLYYFY